MRARTSRLVALCSGVTISSSRPIMSSLVSAWHPAATRYRCWHQPSIKGLSPPASTERTQVEASFRPGDAASAGELLRAAVAFDKPYGYATRLPGRSSLPIDKPAKRRRPTTLLQRDSHGSLNGRQG